MARIGLLEKIVKLCKVQPIILEVWDDNDLFAKKMRPYIKYITKRLQEEHPEIEILWTTRTNNLRNFDHPFIAGQFYGYVIKISPNIDPYELKKTCMGLEEDEQGKRRADIDVYLSWRKKITRKDLDPHCAAI